MIDRIRARLASHFFEGQNTLFRKRFGLNSKLYWDSRFKSNWQSISGRLQTAYFAASFAAQELGIPKNIATVLDYGCGMGDSLPILQSMFPEAKIYFHDVSTVAMLDATKRFQRFATPLLSSADKQFDLVYCSNVVEHILDSRQFVENMAKLSRRFIVLQAPYNERHVDGSNITPACPKDEHIATIDESFLKESDFGFRWASSTGIIPVAWDSGEQIFFVGEHMNDAQRNGHGVSFLAGEKCEKQ